MHYMKCVRMLSNNKIIRVHDQQAQTLVTNGKAGFVSKDSYRAAVTQGDAPSVGK